MGIFGRTVFPINKTVIFIPISTFLCLGIPSMPVVVTLPSRNARHGQDPQLSPRLGGKDIILLFKYDKRWKVIILLLISAELIHAGFLNSFNSWYYYYTYFLGYSKLFVIFTHAIIIRLRD